MSLLRPARRQHQQFLNPVPTQVGGFRTMLKVVPQFLIKRGERTPGSPLGPFRTDPAAYRTSPLTGLRVTWFGHSCLLIELDGTRILVDPVWDQRASPSRFLGPKRFFPPTIPLYELPELDAVLISHDHYDHLGEATVRALAKSRPALRWITSLNVGRVLRRFGVPADQIQELDWTDEATVRSCCGGSCQITSLPARHFSGRSLHDRFRTLWGSFMLRGPQHSVYFGADSGHWSGFAEIGRTHGPFDLTMLEIGAYNELWHDIHLGPHGAIRAFQEMGARGLLMPIHWGLFDLAFHGWREPIQQIERLAAEHRILLWSPEPGIPGDVHRGAPLFSRWWEDSPQP